MFSRNAFFIYYTCMKVKRQFQYFRGLIDSFLVSLPIALSLCLFFSVLLYTPNAHPHFLPSALVNFQSVTFPLSLSYFFYLSLSFLRRHHTCLIDYVEVGVVESIQPRFPCSSLNQAFLSATNCVSSAAVQEGNNMHPF